MNAAAVQSSDAVKPRKAPPKTGNHRRAVLVTDHHQQVDHRSNGADVSYNTTAIQHRGDSQKRLS